MEEESIDLNSEVVKSLACGKVSKQHSKDIIDIDFSSDGAMLYTCDETTLNVYDTRTTRKLKTLFLKSAEIVRLCHTHNNYAVLVATKKQHQIFYWSIHQNAIVKVFKGHTDLICDLEICPPDDYFLTTSRDQTVRLWCLQSNNYSTNSILDLYEYSTCSYPVANFDPKGLIFAVSFTEVVNNITVCRICLYDKNDYEMGAFKSWTKEYSEIKILKFSPCGKYLIAATADNLIVVLDSYEGAETNRFTNFQNQNSVIECSITPDSKFVFSGSETGTVHVWSLNPQEKVVELNGHVEKSQCVKFSPKNCLLVSAGRNIFWWIPRRKGP